jgi:hypothetical protein
MQQRPTDRKKEQKMNSKQKPNARYLVGGFLFIFPFLFNPLVAFLSVG